MKQLFFLFFSLFLLNCCLGQSVSDKKSLQERISRIENRLQSNLQIRDGENTNISYYHIEDRMKALNIPGVSIAVMNNGILEWAKGYGIADRTENRKVTPKTLFQAGSISKPIAATRTLQLAEEGKIHLDSNVNDYLKTWKLPDNDFTKKEKATARRLMTHAAGLTVHGFPGYSRKDTIPSIVNVLDGKGNTAPVRVFRAPGEGWQYSGGGYTIMQLLITDMEQKAFPDIMQEHVLNPLGMTASTYANPLPKKYHTLAAAGYYSDGSEVEGNWHVYPEMAAAGLWTTPSQLVLWTQEIQHIAQNQQDGILKAKTVNEMLTEHKGNQGLGPYVLEHVFGHGGADEGFRADLMAWKEKPISVAIMVNSDNGNTLIRELFLSIAQEYDLPGIAPTRRTYRAQSATQLQRYVGKYDFQEAGEAQIIIKDNGLEFSEGPANSPIFLLPENDTTFFSKATGLYFRFTFEGEDVHSISVTGYEAKKVD
ncbi:serine hydrolase [Spongiimicrobium salis]|uniref:serine hydrolase n=1 Tax=Spongiimicrobium salis TaxID=1667022 RepID=UPI00374DE77D